MADDHPGLIAQLAFPDGVPYAIIGKAIVALLALVILVSVVGVLVLALMWVWNRAFLSISERMWKGYSPHGPIPPLWKLRISGVTSALATFRFTRLGEAYRNAEEMADDKTTLRDYAKSIHYDD